MKRHPITTLFLFGFPLLLSAAVSVNVTRIVDISDNDSVTTGDAGYDSTPSVLGTTSALLNNVSDSADLGYRFTGYNSGRGVNNFNQQVRSIEQSIRVELEWTLSADAGETYDFTINSELEALLRMFDDSSGESGDEATLSNFVATLTLNEGSTNRGTLTLSGDTRTAVGATAISDSGSRVFTNLTGDNTVSLVYEATSTAAWKIAGFRDNRTAAAVLLGEDGRMDGDVEFADDFDEYNSSTARNDDGLSITGTVEVTAVPEPSLSALLAGMVGLAFLFRRRSQA